MRSSFAIPLALMVMTGPANAVGTLDALLGKPGTCYYRAYDAAHLRTHASQRVTEIAIRYKDSFQDENFDLTLDLVFTLRNGETYAITGLCRGNICGAEGDGGAFTVTGSADRIRLAVDPDRGLGAEGLRDYSGNLFDSDDKVFLLYPASSATCDWQP